jgi:hypothetical protein
MPEGDMGSHSPLASWRLERLDKEDGRYLLLYSWRSGAAGTPADAVDEAGAGDPDV